MSLFAELKRRNVFRVAVAYIIAAWVLVEAVTLLLDVFGAPAWVSRLFVGILMIGFPFALMFSWAFEMTPEGLKRESEVKREESITRETARRLDLVTIGLVVAAVALLAVDRFVFVEETRPVAPTAAAEGKVSIAVLPFVNMSGDEENEYFSDGISEELLNLLAGIDQFAVASRTSSFSFKGHETPIPEIAGQLGVRHVLEGSVRKQQDRVRITAQLIDALSDRHLWSATYDRELSDIFAIQDEIASQIANALRTELGIELDASSVTGNRPTQNLEAYELYLEGRELWLRRGQANLEEAMERLQRAAELDPRFSEAWSQLAAVYTVYPNWSTAPMGPWQRLAEGTAHVAIGLDPRDALAHAVIGSVQYEEGNFADAYAQMADAREADPASVTFQLWSMEMALVLGYVESATRFHEGAIERDPLSAQVHASGAWLAAISGDSSRAAALEERARQLGIGPLYYWAFSDAVKRRDLREAEAILGTVEDVSYSIGADAKSVQAGLAALEDPARLAAAETALRQFTEDLKFLDPVVLLFCEELGLMDLAVDLIREYGAARTIWQSRLWRTDSPLLADARIVDWVSDSSFMPAWQQHGPPDGCRLDGNQLLCDGR